MNEVRIYRGKMRKFKINYIIIRYIYETETEYVSVFMAWQLLGFVLLESLNPIGLYIVFYSLMHSADCSWNWKITLNFRPKNTQIVGLVP